eukprot:TRINITY_DN4471_c0_g1_i2.p1 TRINITY_DN4471_c0_g1~~TRINITY_DN4471_c0_g1_i2.p1  ORF type:complete len:168 (-),score=55.45 TRINITY_DN4471_c0_g1_i2:26-529(-)
MSVAKIDRVEKNTLFLSGIDLIDGTPVLDVKPYIALSDHVDTTAPWWMNEEIPQREVELTDGARDALSHVVSQLREEHHAGTSLVAAKAGQTPAEAAGAVETLVRDVLRFDVRSVHTQRDAPDAEHCVDLDAFHVVFRVQGHTVTVCGVTLAERSCKAAYDEENSLC